jgi:hypothetical protein
MIVLVYFYTSKAAMLISLLLHIFRVLTTSYLISHMLISLLRRHMAEKIPKESESKKKRVN